MNNYKHHPHVKMNRMYVYSGVTRSFAHPVHHPSSLAILFSTHSHLTASYITSQSPHNCSHRPTISSQLLTSPHSHITATHIASHSPHSCSYRLTFTSQLLTTPHNHLTASHIASQLPYSC